MAANFRSDNETPVAPQVWARLEEANQGTAWAYAEDQWSERLDEAFSELFETKTRVMPIATGTAANAIALATVSPPWGTVFCHRDAHIYCDESGAPEFYGNGLRLVPVHGEHGKITPGPLADAIHASEGHGVHSYVPAALSVTQSTESGTVYELAELEALYQVALAKGISTHMDGARFGNAVAALGCSPADTSWRSGAQMLSFGASKNGCMAAEALLFFEHHELLETAERHRKRSGHLLSKMRYVSAQLLAYIENGLWLDLARHANQQAAVFASAVEAHPEAQLEFPVGANEVFVRWSAQGLEQLASKDIQFHLWPGHDDLARFVFGHSTTDEETSLLIDAMGG
ncbi:MAG: low specificity L-threonine aldolase [Xanthomonadales bacterium]|nr:low specificity L-threonine aldolase [Xanthomonadales bacterium]NNL94673.1 low specificity L-threonine aldolase [Xanthomonadales bacterium]